ncbi:MAG TPA: hypothetical protein VFR32_09700 [Gaiellaceae bacterium]|nr:hypothetical protein [Gaiellaceae bacterium]
MAAAGALAFSLWPSGNHAVPSQDVGRTVLVAEGGAALPETRFYALRDCLGNPTTCVNGTEGIVLTYAVAGTAPRKQAGATVLTDENCEPDRYGISHCLNRLRLDAGGQLVVRHDHNMGNDPCLAPGERVTVRRLV